MNKVQHIVLPDDFEGRVESGTVQFGEDWPGVFIRGDNAGYYAMGLKMILDKFGTDMDVLMERAVLENLIRTLSGCNVSRRPGDTS